MKKKQKKTDNDEQQKMDTDAANKDNHDSELSSDDDGDEELHEGTSDEGDDNELMTDELENAELLDFDFEALPLHENDKEGIVNMLTQMFLRANVDVESMADKMIERSPLGCVFLPAEDNAEDGNENVVYGVLSILPLNPDEKYVRGFWTLLIERAKKYAVDKGVVQELEALSHEQEKSQAVLLVNERMLHFSSSIAKPAFSALISDLKNDKKANNFTSAIVIMKIRIADTGSQTTSSDTKKGKRKLGKAEKRRLRALALTNSEVIFDNPEEKLLFEDKEEVKFFQYPVYSDVEKDSKFNATVVHGVTFRPYRRVCIINHKLFDRFLRTVANNNV
uniref:Protein BCCIP homolog n=1 Tax=Syphacia muris TaxID=451379 RepID=A0A0N5APH2_9BILA